ncbi:MAG: VOC family protein [Acidobacteria bacterium]|nr:VOC family protein [Acidobacteriota bacterium]
MISNRSMPSCTVIPELPYPNIGEAITWLSNAFGFRLRLRIADHRAQMNVRDGSVVLTEYRGPGLPPPCQVMVRVEDVAAHAENARRHGATIVQPPADFPYGERQYSAVDLAGHCWCFSQSIADVDPADWGGETGIDFS